MIFKSVYYVKMLSCVHKSLFESHFDSPSHDLDSLRVLKRDLDGQFFQSRSDHFISTKLIHRFFIANAKIVSYYLANSDIRHESNL